RSVVTGAENVAANLLRFWGPGSTLVSHPVGGQPALLGFHGRALAALLVLRMRGEQVEAVHVIADPAQIGFLRRRLATSAGGHRSAGCLVVIPLARAAGPGIPPAPRPAGSVAGWPCLWSRNRRRARRRGGWPGASRRPGAALAPTASPWTGYARPPSRLPNVT